MNVSIPLKKKKYIIQLCNPFARTISYNTLRLCNLCKKMKRKKMLIFDQQVCLITALVAAMSLFCTAHFFKTGFQAQWRRQRFSFGGAVG